MDTQSTVKCIRGLISLIMPGFSHSQWFPVLFQIGESIRLTFPLATFSSFIFCFPLMFTNKKGKATKQPQNWTIKSIDSSIDKQNQKLVGAAMNARPLIGHWLMRWGRQEVCSQGSAREMSCHSLWSVHLGLGMLAKHTKMQMFQKANILKSNSICTKVWSKEMAC
jgi:hypothetical protein